MNAHMEHRRDENTIKAPRPIHISGVFSMRYYPVPHVVEASVSCSLSFPDPRRLASDAPNEEGKSVDRNTGRRLRYRERSVGSSITHTGPGFTSFRVYMWCSCV